MIPPSELGKKTLKRVLLQLRAGEPIEVTTRDLANYHNGGMMHIKNGGRSEPFNRMEKREKSAAIVLAYRELRLLLINPPEGVFAEELQGPEFKVRFLRIENGGQT